MGHLGEVIAKQVKPNACFVVTIRDNEGYVRQSNVFRDTIKAGGVKIAGEESIVAADSDFSALSTKVAASGADCLFMSTPPAQGANIVLQVKQAGGLAGKAILVGNTGMTSDQYVKTGGKAIDNTYIPADFLPTGVNDLAKSFIDKYTKTYKTAPDGWAAIGYSMTRVVANAIKNAGPNVTRESLRDAMLKTKDVPVVIGDGTFSIDADRVPHYGTAVIVLRDGKWDKP
jgi:branched-chain amino acid transport system substrate-binding protein